MGLKKVTIGLSLLIFFVIPMVLALDTPIQVKTQPNYVVTIRALDISGTGTLEGGAFLDQIADEDGYVSVTYSSDIVNQIDISLMIKTAIGGTTIQFAGGPVQVFKNNGEHIKTGWPVEIDTTINPPILIKFGKPIGATEESPTNSLDIGDSNITSSSEDSSVVEDNQELEIETGTTGKSIGVGKSILTSKITYFILGLLIIVFVVWFIFKKKLINSHHSEYKKPEFKVLSKENSKPINTERPERNSRLRDAEIKLEEAKKELEEIKQMNEKEGRIRQAKERFERDKRALEKLERE